MKKIDLRFMKLDLSDWLTLFVLPIIAVVLLGVVLLAMQSGLTTTEERLDIVVKKLFNLEETSGSLGGLVVSESFKVTLSPGELIKTEIKSYNSTNETILILKDGYQTTNYGGFQGTIRATNLDDYLIVPPEESATIQIEIQASPNCPAGTYEIRFVIEYI